jgi:hypothetical protein
MDIENLRKKGHIIIFFANLEAKTCTELLKETKNAFKNVSRTSILHPFSNLGSPFSKKESKFVSYFEYVTRHVIFFFFSFY